MSHRALLPPRLLAVVAPVCVVGAVVFTAAAVAFVDEQHSATTLVGIIALTLASAVAQRYPVPVEGVDMRGVALGFVFGVAAVVLFGWSAGCLIAAISQAIAGTWERHPPIRVAFNAAVYGIAAALAGVVISPIGHTDPLLLVAVIAISSVVQWAVNLFLITAVVRAGRGGNYWSIMRQNIGWTWIPFALMSATGLILVVLWEREPVLLLALLGPLLAISLYQRSQHRALNAMRLALTDPLTGLGNHRHFHERLQRELAIAQEHELPLTLCLVDLDDFKSVNDRFGHPTGDRVLEALAARLRQGGEAFRLGGDEFAILLPNHTGPAGHAVARSVVTRVGAVEIDGARPATVSVGMATFPSHGIARDELIRLADGALYRAKELGKNRVVVAEPDVAQPT